MDIEWKTSLGARSIFWISMICCWGHAVQAAPGDTDDLDVASSLFKGGKAAYSLTNAYRKITAEDEYYIGRAVAARIVARYGAYEDPAAHAYLNRVGQTLALASRKPEVFNAYRFMILDSDEAAAFASPGAFVFVTRGMLRLAGDEDMLAAVLAHEISHVEKNHGRRLIKEKHWKTFWADVATAAAFSLSDKLLARLSSSLGSMAGAYFKTLHTRGHEKELELEADAGAVRLMERAGYDPYAAIELLEAIAADRGVNGKLLARTHPKPAQRIAKIEPLVGEARTRPQIRERRFHEALARAREP